MFRASSSLERSKSESHTEAAGAGCGAKLCLRHAFVDTPMPSSCHPWLLAGCPGLLVNDISFIITAPTWL